MTDPCVIVDFVTKKAYIVFHRYQLDDLVKALEDNPDAPTMGLVITFTEVIKTDTEVMLK